MQLEHKVNGDVLEITVHSDRIDAANAVYLKDQFKAATADHTGRVVMDMGQVEFMDSSGLGAMVAALKLLNGRKLELAGLLPAVDKVFTLTRMNTVFVLHRSMDDAAIFRADDTTAA